MLKKFFMNALSSFIGAWIALVLFGVVAVLVCIGLFAKLGVSASQGESVAKGSILTIELEGVIAEREIPTDFDYMSLLQGDVKRPQTLTSLVTAIGEGKENKNISALYLKCKGVSASLATLNTLRAAVADFRASGKKVIAYADNYSMGDYYVASAGDKVYINPAGAVELKGIGGTSIFMKGLFDKLGVKFQVVKVGTYKSAVEPYILTEMSAPARAQLDTLYGSLWAQVREELAKSRKKLSSASIDSLVSRDFVFLQPASFDVKAGLVDVAYYERSMDSIIAAVTGKNKDKLNFVSPSAMLGQTDWGQAYGSKKQVAVLYACGEIVDGGGPSTINYEKLVPQIVKLAEDDNVKGMVLRVNSPGGAVFGSEQIGEALDYFMSKGKPLAVSMGDYAASGGYWISCCADRIFANPMTITGSIGIFGLIPEAQGLAEKIGVNPQLVATNPGAAFPSVFYPMTDRQYAAMQSYVEKGYDKFVARVARGRKMPESKVRVIGEGRVWGAAKALEIGLVDELGDLQDAVKWTAGKADMAQSYDVALYPTIESTVWDMMPELTGMKMQDALQRALSGDYTELAVRFARNVLQQKPVQARMPYMSLGFVSR